MGASGTSCAGVQDVSFQYRRERRLRVRCLPARGRPSLSQRDHMLGGCPHGQCRSWSRVRRVRAGGSLRSPGCGHSPARPPGARAGGRASPHRGSRTTPAAPLDATRAGRRGTGTAHGSHPLGSRPARTSARRRPACSAAPFLDAGQAVGARGVNGLGSDLAAIGVAQETRHRPMCRLIGRRTAGSRLRSRPTSFRDMSSWGSATLLRSARQLPNLARHGRFVPPACRFESCRQGGSSLPGTLGD